MTPLILFGDSQTRCIELAAQRRQEDRVAGGMMSSAFTFQRPFLWMRQGELHLSGVIATSHYWEWVNRHREVDIRDCVGRLVVCMGFGSATFYADPSWATRTWDGCAHQVGHLVSRQVLATAAGDLQAEVLKFLRFGADHGLIAAIVEGPPPQARHPRVMKMGAAGAVGLHDIFADPVRRFARERDIPLIDGREAADGEGVLKPEYWGPDPSHANHFYGDIILDKLFRRFGLDLKERQLPLPGFSATPDARA